ncbi:MAG: hypothetical protein MUF15_00695, partial [Acidobacteria bacterium]|nr:hypothetical protein [Acidobacteriota bacterium]
MKHLTKKCFHALAIILLMVCAFVVYGAETSPGSVPKGMTVYVTGNAAWVTTAHQPATVFMGGGPECDEAMAWLTAKTAGGDF